MTPSQASILDAVDEAAALSWLRRAVQCPSVTGNELSFGEIVKAELQACASDRVELLGVAPGRPVVWSFTRGRSDGLH